MDQIDNMSAMLTQIESPAFFVREGIITEANHSAQQRMIAPGTDIFDLLATGAQEYREFEGGCLYLTLQVCGCQWDVSVMKLQSLDLFVIEQEADEGELQAMALAAQQLSTPLNNIMNTADSLFPVTKARASKEDREKLARINRGLFQMQRIICNMASAYRYRRPSQRRMELRDVDKLLDELLQKNGELIRYTGSKLTYKSATGSVHSMVDEEALERAVNNILSNALKFSPAGSTIECTLSRRRNMLYLTVQTKGFFPNEELRKTLHSRYRRAPGIDDGRFGIGLGMILIRTAAAAHDGTVLIEQDPEQGVRLTMTLKVRQSSGVSQSVFLPLLTDYAGGRDHSLLELSDCLPWDLYDVDNIN